MFEIKFKVFSNAEIEANNLNGEYGYFYFSIDEDSYGVIISEEINDFSVSIYDWFFSFLSGLKILEDRNYVLINDIESFKIWIEIQRKDDCIYISKASGEKVDGGGLVRTEKILAIEYPYWKNKKIVWSNFRKEIINKATQYLLEISKLNSPGNINIVELKKLIEELS